MFKHAAVIAFAVFGACISTPGQNAGAANEFIALENHFNDALVRADWKAIEQIEADDLVFTTADGKVTHKSDDVYSLQSGDTRFESIHMSDLEVQNFGNVVVVTGKLVEKGRYKTADIGGTYRFTDVWAKRSGRWQLVTGQETLCESPK